MRYRIYDNVDKKYIPEEHANHFFCLDIYGKVVKYDHVLGFMETGDRYTVEVSIGDNLFINDVCKEACLVKGTKNGYTGNFSAEVERVVFYNDIEKRYELRAIRMTVDKSIKNPCFELEKYSLPFIPKDIKVTSNIHGGSDER